MKNKFKYYENKVVWIIGASAGIGKALAFELDHVGAKLILSSRSGTKLDDMGKSFKNKPLTIPFDVSNLIEFQSEANNIFKQYQLDYIIYLPAFYEPSNLSRLDFELINKTLSINLKSVFYLISIALPYMKKNPAVTLAITASVAGYMGLANAQPYGATKAGVINLVESFKAEHPTYSVKLINPGFVRTRLTDKNNFKMPFIISPGKAANYILKGLLTNKFEVHFPKKFTLLLKIIQKMPYWLYFKLLKKFT
ncbi:SDR family NAD(P)-dependent oxidoreductase [Thiotrichales bacterium 19S3-7]|nr:SDR family NAD(P)-dependent oxidoreductase [Thiotrichales bacterium 19S3-7]MCF6800636.1 SDR family NAD(P)-dependent oxidoreductase [Thiotrichales bacterium 19S3-11]